MLGGLPHFVSFYHQESHHTLRMKTIEKFPCAFSKVRGIETILKHFHLNKGLSSRKTLLPEPSQSEGRKILNSNASSLPVSHKMEKKAEKYLRKSQPKGTGH